MQRAEPKSENQYLLISTIGNLLLGCVGIAFSLVSSSQAIMLDGLFNLSYFAAGLFTIKVASLLIQGDDERFPYGYAFFEPLVNGIKGLLVLGVSIMALFGAIQALLEGGRTIEASTAIVYGVLASIVCWVLAYIAHVGAKSTNSPLVKADSENWVVNAAISSCVLLAFAGILVLNALGLDHLTPYVDPTVVILVVAISIGVPVRMAWTALMALLNRAPSRDIVKHVTDIVDQSLTDLPVKERFVRVIQPGRDRMVLVHVVLPADYAPEQLSQLDGVRRKTHGNLCESHVATVVDMLFTTDRRWGAPLSEGGFGSQTK